MTAVWTNLKVRAAQALLMVASVPLATGTAWAQAAAQTSPDVRVAALQAKKPRAAARSQSSRASAAKRESTCDWDNPGHSPFMGDVVGAVDGYTDIPAPVRDKLKARMAARTYDDIVSIRRDSISGKGQYESGIRQMHFGDRGRVCGTVTRNAWTPQMEERGLVYCESGECILVPTVCRNVSRISRLPGGAVVAGPPGGAAPPVGELPFDPPAAGPLPPGGVTPVPPVADVSPSSYGPSVPFFPFYPIGGSSPPPIFVVVPSVPEPASVLTMLAGLGVLVAVARRRPGGAAGHRRLLTGF